MDTQELKADDRKRCTWSEVGKGITRHTKHIDLFAKRLPTPMVMKMTKMVILIFDVMMMMIMMWWWWW